jgi:hypothetical protein
MIKNIFKTVLAVSILTMIVLTAGLFKNFAYAQETTDPSITNQSIADSICQGVLGTQNPSIDTRVKAKDCKENGTDNFTGVIKRIINIFSIVVGAVSVVMIIIGGFRYIISGGDSTGVSGAKNTILYALVGLVIVLFAQVIVKFVVSNVTSATKTTNNTSTSQQTSN